MKEFTADREQTLKEFTDNTYAQGSFFWNYLLRRRDIRVNGRKTGENVLLRAGDRVAITSPPRRRKSLLFPSFIRMKTFWWRTRKAA